MPYCKRGKTCLKFSLRTCQRRSQCSTVICVIFKLAIGGVATIRLRLRRYWGVRVWRLPKCLRAIKRLIAALFKGKPYEPMKTVGNLEAALVGGGGRCVRGETPMAQWEEFSFSRGT